LTYAIHEISREVPTHTLKLIALGVLACTNIASVVIESRNLKNKDQHFSASSPATIFHVITRKPILSSCLAQV